MHVATTIKSKVCYYNATIWEKPLSDGSSAVMVLNRGDAEGRFAVDLFDLSDNTHNTWSVRDVWAMADLPVATAQLVLTVPAHGARLMRMKPVSIQ